MVEALARERNPELRSAFAALQVSEAGTSAAKAALLPALALNFSYGIDATNFGVNGPDGIRNLGYSMSAALDIPVWDWLATERRIKAAKVREGAARVALTAAQRRLLVQLAEFYTEAEVAKRQTASLDGSVQTAREWLRLHPTEGPIAEEISADAILAPLSQAAIAPRINAPIHAEYVQRGSHVRRGQLLVTLEDGDLRGSVLDNAGVLAVAQANAMTATRVTIPEEQRRAELEVAQLEAARNVADRTSTERKRLFEQGALSGREADSAINPRSCGRACEVYVMRS